MNFKEKIEFERQKIAERVLEKIQNGNLEWVRGWHKLSEVPINAKTDKRYNGTNLLVLWLEGQDKQYKDPRWLTFNQAKELGAQVKAGEKATTIFHWNEYDKKTKAVPNWEEINKLAKDERDKYILDNIKYSISYHSVFNAEQCKGLAAYVAPVLSAEELAKQNEKIERVIANSAAPVLYDGKNRAYYSTSEDKIHLPKIEIFKSKDDYYATALHEIAHSTGHTSRLNRDMSGDFGSEKYAIEELRAEFASLFMQSELDVRLDGSHFDSHAAYIQSWSEDINKDKNILFGAIKDAGDIATYVRENYAEGKKTQEKNEGETMAEEQAKTETVEAEKKTQEKIKINPLKVVRSTEKAVMVQLVNSEATTNRLLDGAQPAMKDTWLPKSKIDLDEKGESVVAVDYFLKKQYGDALVKNEITAAKTIERMMNKVGVDTKDLKQEIKNAEKTAEQPALSGKELAQKMNNMRLDNLAKNVPAEMKALPNWCVFKLFKDKESGKYNKFVVNPNKPEGGWASHKDPETWTTFDKAMAYAKEHNGAGLSFAIKGSGFNAFDLDHCYDKETKTYNETAKKFLADLPNSYAERSVSGTGLHIFTKGSVCENGKYNEARGGAAVEVFETWGFISMTGNVVDEQHKNLVDLPDEVKKSIQTEIGEKKVFQAQTQPNRNQYHNYAKSDNEVIAAIRNSKKCNEFVELMNGVDLCGDHSRSDAKLMNILAYFTNANTSQMESIFKQSKLYRPNKGDAYVERTAKYAANSLNQRAQ